LLDFAAQPQTVEALLSRLNTAASVEAGHGFQLLKQFCDRGLLSEVII
jgi:hypothetical protein